MAVAEGTKKAIEDLVRASGQYTGYYNDDIIDKVNANKDMGDMAFNFIDWINKNWQLAILGVVALLVLLKE